MFLRKLLMIGFVAMATLLPLVGCSGQTAGGGAGDDAGDTSNTTATE